MQPLSRPRSHRSLRFLLVAALCLATLPFAGESLASTSPPFDEVRDSGFPRFTYYRATRIDMRLCPAPYCGGFFVERINRNTTKCADGTWARECHAAIVDFSALGLSPAEEAELLGDFGAKRLLVRGALVEDDAGIGIPIPTLVAKDAWRGATGSQPGRGAYWGVIPSGIQCITFPCPTLLRFKINGPRVGWLHSIDFSQSGATQEQIDDALFDLYQGPGLIGFGRMFKITGPAGVGREFRPTEFYLKVEEDTPPACGGFTYPPNPPCASGEFCEPPAGTCFVADLPGTCQVIPDACITVVDPVCGCDGRTYGNDCERQRAQVALDHPGPCSPPPPQPCGSATCVGGLTCCNPAVGLCVPPDHACVKWRSSGPGQGD